MHQSHVDRMRGRVVGFGKLIELLNAINSFIADDFLYKTRHYLRNSVDVITVILVINVILSMRVNDHFYLLEI